MWCGRGVSDRTHEADAQDPQQPVQDRRQQGERHRWHVGHLQQRPETGEEAGPVEVAVDEGVHGTGPEQRPHDAEVAPGDLRAGRARGERGGAVEHHDEEPEGESHVEASYDGPGELEPDGDVQHRQTDPEARRQDGDEAEVAGDRGVHRRRPPGRESGSRDREQDERDAPTQGRRHALLDDGGRTGEHRVSHGRLPRFGGARTTGGCRRTPTRARSRRPRPRRRRAGRATPRWRCPTDTTTRSSSPSTVASRVRPVARQ